MERVDDCCAAQRGSILSGDGMLSLGPAVSVNVENADRIAYRELPVKSTAETGSEVNQSDSYCPNSSVAVFPCLHPALDQGEVCREGKALNDMESSIIQHDSTDCEQFEGAVGMGLSTPSSYDKANIFSDGCLEQCADFPEGEEILYINPVPVELPQSGIQPDDTPRRPARVAARPSRFRDDQFETEFRPGPRKYKVRQVSYDPGKAS